MKRAFTLIELLVVIAIIAILAAILFPVFAQAKLAAKKTSDLSNIKQLMTSALIYANDADDALPNNRQYQTYIFAARLLPYTKNRGIFKNPAASAPEGTIQRKQGANGGPYITPPDDACIGLGTSTKTAKEFYNDIYPPDDYEVNKFIFGTAPANCGDNDFTVGPNTTSGGVTNGGTDGNPVTVGFTSPSKVVLWTDYPISGLQYPGNNLVPFWGSKFTYFAGQANASFIDGHAKSYPFQKLLPGLNGDNNSYNNCSWVEGVTLPDKSGNGTQGACYGKSWNWWGTNLASSDNQ